MEWLALLLLIAFLFSHISDTVNGRTKEREDKAREDAERSRKRIERQTRLAELSARNRLERENEKTEGHATNSASTHVPALKPVAPPAPAPVSAPAPASALAREPAVPKALSSALVQKEVGAIEKEFMRRGISSLWHMTHVSNIPSIAEQGLLSHTEVIASNARQADISNGSVQRRREAAERIHGRKIHDYVPLYLNPRNPMLFNLREMQADLCFIEIALSVLFHHQFLITDGNAAASNTRFFVSPSSLDLMPWDVLAAEYWTNFDDGKRKRCAEVLIYPKIDVQYIKSVRFHSALRISSVVGIGAPVLSANDMYFA